MPSPWPVSPCGSTATPRGSSRWCSISWRTPSATRPQAARLTSRSGTRPTSAAGPARRVALIEHNADARESLRVLLELYGHEVHEAADGLTGVELVLRLRPDVTFIDIGLPGVDGYEVAQRIRATP